MSDLSLPLAAEELIPHRLPMRLIDRLVAIEGKNGMVEACVGADSPLVGRDGLVDEPALIEIMAQSYAALKGYLDRREQRSVRQGFLVGIKKFDCYAPARVDELLQISIRTVAEFDDFAVAEGEIRRAGEVIAAGDVKVWIN